MQRFRFIVIASQVTSIEHSKVMIPRRQAQQPKSHTAKVEEVIVVRPACHADRAADLYAHLSIEDVHLSRRQQKDHKRQEDKR